MKAAEKKKIADMILELAGISDWDFNEAFAESWDFLEENGFDHFIRSCEPKNGAKLPPLPRDTKDKIHIMIARETEANAYYWWGANSERQVWVTLDKDFALKALFLGYVPKPEPAAA